MPTNNIIANLFTTLFNTEDRRKSNCVVIPTSKLGMEVLKTLKNEGYIGDFEYTDDKRGGKFSIQLLAKITKCGAITPRFKVKKDEYNTWEQQFLQNTVGRQNNKKNSMILQKNQEFKLNYICLNI